MKYFKVEYIARGKKGHKMMKAQTKKDVVALTKGKVPGVVLKIDEIDAPLEDRVKDFLDNVKKSLFKNKINPDAL